MLRDVFFCASLLVVPLAPALLARMPQDQDQEQAPTEEQSIEAIHQLLEDQDPGAALKAASDLVDERSRSARAWGMFAYLMYASGDTDRGADCLRRGRGIDEFAPEVVWVDATLMLGGGQEAATEFLAKVQRALQEHPGAHLLIQLHGDLLLALGKFDDATTVFVDGLEHCTTERQLLGLLMRTARVTVQNKQWELAETTITRILELRDEGSLLATRSEARMEQGKFGAALEDLAALLTREEVQSSQQAIQQVEGMRATVAERYAEAAGPIAPLCWLLRRQPGDAELERRIADEVAVIRAAGPDHPYAQLVIPPLLEIREVEGGDDDGMQFLRVLEARTEAVAKVRVRLPSELSDRRLQVDNSVYSDTPAFRRAGDWQGAESFLTQQLTIYPESRGYLERSLVKAHARDWSAALRDADTAVAMEALETSEDPDRDSVLGPGNTRQQHALELAAALRRLASDRAAAAESLVLVSLVAQDEERWAAAYEAFMEIQEMEPDGNTFFSTRLKGQLLETHRADIADAFVAQGRAALEAEDITEAQRIDEILSWNFAGHPAVYSFTAGLARQMEDFERMQQELVRLLTYEAFNPEAHYLLGLLAKERGDLGRALLYFNAGAGPMNDLDEVAALTGFPGDCAEQRARLELQVDEAEGYKLYADSTNEVLGSDDAPGALAVAGLTRLIEMGGPRSQLISIRCSQLINLNAYERALVDADLLEHESQATDGERLVGAEARAIALRFTGRLKECGEAYGAYAELVPESPLPREQQGFVLQELGEIEAAIVAFLQAIELGSRSEFVYMELGECYALQGNWSEASSAASEATTLATENDNLMLGMRASNANMKWLSKSFDELFGQ